MTPVMSLLCQVKAERASITAKHASALHDLQRLPCFIRLLAQLILQVGRLGRRSRLTATRERCRCVLSSVSARRLLLLDAAQSEQGLMCALHAAVLGLSFLQSQLDLLVSAVLGLRQHLQVPGNALQVDLLLQAPVGVTMNPGQDETLKVRLRRPQQHTCATFCQDV